MQAISVIVRPSASSRRPVWVFAVVITGGRPPRRPRARAAARPAIVRSRSSPRSNSARLPNTCNNSWPPRGGGVYRLLERPETHSPAVEVGDGLDQIAQGSAEAVQPPDDHDVAGAQPVGQRRQLRPAGRRPRRGIGEHPPAASRPQRVVLQR